ncbi:MAG: sensor domain-containing diguanylate cyclase/phosphohydrolase [Actinomycetota bacterium]
MTSIISKTNFTNFKKLFTDYPFPLAAIDRDKNILAANRKFLAFFRLEKKSQEQRGLHQLMEIEERDRFEAAIRKAFENGQAGRIEIKTKIGRHVARVEAIGRAPDIWAAIITVEDISSVEKVSEEIEKSEERFKSLFDNALDSIMLLELDPEKKDAVIIEANRTACRVYGYFKDEIVGASFCKILSGENKEDCEDIIQKIYKRRGIKFEMVNLTKHGKKINVDASCQLFHLGEKEAAILISRNITEKKKEEEKIRFLSFRDSLTGLYNREYFEEELKRLNTNRQLPLSIVVADLNSLKLINDAFGHKEGDRMLRKAAEVLRSSCRKEDIIARWGGDEFIILLPKTGADKSEQLIKRIKEGCLNYSGQDIQLSISLGYATKQLPSENISKVLRKAEDRMYKNKVLERKSIYSGMLDALLGKLRDKKKESKKHLKYLEGLAEKFGKSMDLSQAKVRDLVLLAGIYDIGKITIPDRILQKKERLNTEEWEIIKRHPEIGFHISEPTPQLLNLAEAILSHHEWWDGTGYPQRLKGDDIPIMARAIAIMDAYDAMTKGRPYKKRLTREQALAELKKYAGIQFDPVLVDKFINTLVKRKGD